MARFLNQIKTYQWIMVVLGTISLLASSVYYFHSFSKSKEYNLDFSSVVIEEGTDYDEVQIRGITLPKGHFALGLGYIASEDCDMYAVLDNEVAVGDVLNSTDGQIVSKTYEFDLTMGTDRGKVDIRCPKGQTISLAYVKIMSDKPIYRDGQIWGILALIAIPVWFIFIYFYGKSEYKFAIIATTMLVVIEVAPFILTHGFYWACDTKGHMMRIEGIYYGLQDGQFPVVICPEWNNSFGQIDVLYPNVFLYIPALFRLMGMSQLGVLKLFTLLIMAASGFVSYLASRTIFKRDWQVMLACFALMIDDMRVHDLMRGGRFGGSLIAEIFWPLLIAGLIDLFFKEGKRWYMLAIGMAGPVCSHVVSASIACIFVFVFVLFNIKKLKDIAVIKGISKSVAFFSMLSLGTIVSFVSFYFTDWGQENLQWCDFVSTLWNISDPFFDKRWISAFTMFIMCTGLLAYIFIRIGKTEFTEIICDKYVMTMYFAGTVMLWMSTDYFPWRLLTKIPAIKYYTNMLQDGFRFLCLAGAVFSLCLPKIIALYIYRTEGSRALKSKIALCSLCALSALAVFNIGKETNKAFNNPSLEKLYYDEVMGDVEYCFEDYLPEGTKSEWYGSDEGYISNEEAVQSFDYVRSGTKTYYSYTNSEEGTYVEFPKFYYKGYVAFDENNNPVELYKGDKNRIRAYLNVTDTPKSIRIMYNVPWYFSITTLVSDIVWIGVIVVLALRLLGWSGFLNEKTVVFKPDSVLFAYNET